MFDDLIKKFIANSDKWSFGLKDKILLFKELGHLLQWGIGISESLDIIWSNTDNYALRDISNTLREQIVQWKSLSNSLLRFPEIFDDTDIATIQSGETSGNLDSILAMLGEEYAYLNTLKNKFIGALTYPIILITISIGAVLALFIFILPAIFEIALQFDAKELPWVTQQLKSFSDFLANNWFSILWVGAFLFFTFFVIFSTETGQKKGYELLYTVPVLWKMIQSYYLIRFSRYTKILLWSGINYVNIFKMLKNVIPNPIFTPLFEKAISGLTRGMNIYDCIKDDTKLIPSTVAALIKVGEKTATLWHTFDIIIGIYQEELDNYIANLSKLIEPIMLVFIGWIVIMIALWVFGVIMNIMDSVNV